MSVTGRSPARTVLFAFVAAALLGLVATTLMLWQPWASCPEVTDGGSAGCPVKGPQLTLQSMTFLFFGASLVGVVVSGALVLRSGRTAPHAPWAG
jgi:hypothetical protein